MSKKFKVLGGIVLAIALVVVGLTTVVLADSPDNSAGATACQTGTWGPMGFRGACDGPLLETVSDVVGLSPEEICELRQEGMSLVEIAEQQGVDEQTLTDAVLAAAAEALQQKVDEGILTQEQVDLILERLTDRVSDDLNRTDFGPAGNGLPLGRHQSLGNRFGGSRLGIGPGGMHRWGAGPG